MSVFSSTQERNNFINSFCSKPLDLREINAINKDRVLSKDHMNPNELYDRLIECREECASRFMNDVQLSICEKNLEILAELCLLNHKEQCRETPRQIEPQKQSTNSFPQRIYNRIFNKTKTPPRQEEQPKTEGFKPQEKASVKQEPICDLIETLCSNLSLKEIWKLDSDAEEISLFKPNESSPHVLYKQLVEIRDRYLNERGGTKAIDPQKLTRLESNLARLAEVCCLEHIRYGSV